MGGRLTAAGNWEGRDNISHTLPGPFGGVLNYSLHKLCKPIDTVAGLKKVDKIDNGLSIQTCPSPD